MYHTRAGFLLAKEIHLVSRLTFLSLLSCQSVVKILLLN